MSDMKPTKEYYFDYAATTPLDPRAYAAMQPFFQDNDLQGNPSSLHAFGRRAKEGLDRARERVAETLSVRSDEIVFTSSGTESDNMAILGAARARRSHGSHVIVSAIEHKAVLESAKALRAEGFSVSLAPAGPGAFVSAQSIADLLQDDTILVSVMLVNNETGAIEPVREIADAIAARYPGARKPLFHTDACQASTIMPIRPYDLGVDLLTLNGAKIYGPKGFGCLWVQSGVRIAPLLYGGDQERGLHPGTENVALAAGFAEALSIAQAEAQQERERLQRLHMRLREGVLRIPGSTINASGNSSPAILNISFRDTEGESVLLELDRYGAACSTGSACAATDLKPSHVLLVSGVPEEMAHASVRFSLGRFTTDEDVGYLLSVLPQAIARIRSVCPTSIFAVIP